jgi:hypothetical protein
MYRPIARLAVVAILLSLCASPAFAQAGAVLADPNSPAWGRQFTTWFYDGQVDSLIAHFDTAMTAALSKDALLQFRDQVAMQGGNETDVLTEAVEPKDRYLIYRREVHMSNAGDMVIVVNWSIDKDRKISGFYIRPKQS